MDLGILQWINGNLHSVPFLNHLIKYITYLGEYGAIWILAAILFVVFKKTRKMGIVLAIALAVDYIIINLILKNVVNRTRPYFVDSSLMDFAESINLYLPKDTSFPSGHAAIAFVSATVILCFNKKYGIIALILAFLISLSRIYLCVHYPTDVLAGMVFGIVIGLAVYFVSAIVVKFIRKKRNG